MNQTELLTKAYSLDDQEQYEEAYELWEQLAREYNDPEGWQMLSEYLYSGKGWKSKSASLFCKLKHLRSERRDVEVLSDLIDYFKNKQTHLESEQKRKDIINQLNELSKWVEEEDEEEINKNLDQLEQLIYGDNKPKSLDDFSILEGN